MTAQALALEQQNTLNSHSTTVCTCYPAKK
ncbi:MAG: hypothetical protein ACR5LD_03505 [Symbiopectobacterium sp.]